MACPAMLVTGKADQNGINLTFLNTGKVPITEVEFYCPTSMSHGTRRSPCGGDNGIFFPGAYNTVRLSPPNTATRSILVSFKSIRLYDGEAWIKGQDQPCRPLRIPIKR